MRRLIALLRLRCPHCYRGPLFRSFWQMYEQCPVCGITYEREHGYFMNAIFFGYILGFIVLLPVNILMFIWEVPPIYFLVANVVGLTLISPLVFRYSRALWMHLDEMIDPRPDEIPLESEPLDG